MTKTAVDWCYLYSDIIESKKTVTTDFLDNNGVISL